MPFAEVPWQPSEIKARGLYRELIAEFPDLPLTLQARLELAEFHAARNDFEPAISLIKEALDKEPDLAMTDHLRLRLGECYRARGDQASALRQFEVVAARRESPLSGQGIYRAAECRMAQKEWAAAAQLFAVFRDEEAFQGNSGLSDRALLRLAHALGQQGRWHESCKAAELLVERFTESPWIPAAHYAIGWANLQRKKDAEAIEAFSQALGEEASPITALAFLATGIARLEQGKIEEALKALESVPDRSSEPEVSALALVEAAYAAKLLQQPDQARKFLQRVVDAFPQTTWAALAREHLKSPPAKAPHRRADAQRLLVPDLADPLLLEPANQYRDWTGTEDPTDEESLALALVRQLSVRKTPFAPGRRPLPDPFESREWMRNFVPPDEPGLLLPR